MLSRTALPLALVVPAFLLAACASSEPAGSEETSTDNLEERSVADCLGDQDMDAPDVDISACPPIPSVPEPALMNGESVSLGAWELGTTADGQNWKYGSLSDTDTSPRELQFEGQSVPVDDVNLTCWAKGYYRLHKILQDPPREYVALRAAGYQYRFFQFQTDLRNGPTGFRKISSYMDHLVKWVTVVSPTGECEQPTLSKFRSYAAGELVRRGIELPDDAEGGDAPTE